MRKVVVALFCLLAAADLLAAGFPKHGDDLKGAGSYDDFEKPTKCRQCHVEIFHQWENAMMSQAYTHAWDEIEYFKLAVGHGQRNEKFKAVADGCNGCHAPLAFWAGDVPPPRPEKGSRANESVSCDVCHTISAYPPQEQFNYSYSLSPGRTKYGTKGGDKSPAHDLETFPGMGSAKLCANCHNEKSPWGVWVKSTYNEWEAGPYSKEGVQCHECHMPRGPGQRSIVRKNETQDIRLHLFHGAHVEAKTRGAIDVLMQTQGKEFLWGDPVVVHVQLFNQKAGHKIPTGSVEDRLLYLHVEAVDSTGRRFHLPVDRKKFQGEEYTIAADTRAYQDLAEMMDVPEGFDGLPRDGVPAGDRIFRMPYFTEKGVMTMAQWNTASLGVDYRIGPRETKVETFTWVVPDEAEPGPVTITATLNYQLLVRPVAQFLGVPEDESRDRVINTASVQVEIIE